MRFFYFKVDTWIPKRYSMKRGIIGDNSLINYDKAILHDDLRHYQNELLLNFPIYTEIKLYDKL